jgi:hypothetical protein
VPFRRRSLGDIFHTVRTKWNPESRAGTDTKIDTQLNQELNMDLFALSKEPTQDTIIDKPDALQEPRKPVTLRPSILTLKPPQLDLVLSSDIQQGKLNRSSTFRNYFEKAVADIDKKYDSAHSSLYEPRGVHRVSSRRKSLPAGGLVPCWPSLDPKSRIGVKKPTLLVDPTPQPFANPITKKIGFNAVSACQSCGTPVDCCNPDKRGIPSHQIGKILGDSIDLRNPPLTSNVPESPMLVDPEHDMNLVGAMPTGGSLAPVQLHDG